MSAFPEQTTGAISLTFDDGLTSHIAKAIPSLDHYGFRGTFYVPAGDNDGGKPALERFRPALEAGHEIGNHSVKHYWPVAQATGPGRVGVEDLSLADMAAELDAACARFKAVFPEIASWSYAYPGYATWIGRGAGRASFVPLVAERFFCARAGGEISTPWNIPGRLDRYCLNSYKCEGKSAEQLIGIVERAAQVSAWSILSFHGVDTEHLTISSAAFETLLYHLDRHRDRIWTAPVIDVAQYLETPTHT
jgi:sialate O-acetylesterase